MSGAARRATTKPDGAESWSAEERLQGYWGPKLRLEHPCCIERRW
jgi:hypothetical protein